ncbi:MAG: DUF1573 domain-containing protein [Cyanobacteria bacterium SZAS LIN-3]|nr:DUF1573 domain-containing protein [Cyanobacteria bacterium SZAS LIN-3]
MGRKPAVILSLFAAALLGAGLFIYVDRERQKAEEAKKPAIWFDSQVIDLGKVDEGVEVTGQFKVANRGGSPLEIEDIKSSCGCTFPVWKRRRLMPGEQVVLPVTVDTAMKQDKVEKTMDVISNDPRRSFVTLTIKIEVNDPHSMLDVRGPSKIFTSEKCTSCHVDQGVGQFGKELFEADCAMCHRPGAKGSPHEGKPSVGPVLESLDLSDPQYVARMRDVIAHGSKTHRSMPGFSAEAGGPLSKEQIDSLVVYLKALHTRQAGGPDEL